jgi:hypothetical protein
MVSINNHLETQLRQRFSNREFGECYSASGTWQTSRYIQILTPFPDSNIHYEYRIDGDWNGRIEIHFEGDGWEDKYDWLIEELREQTQHKEDLNWYNWDYGYMCQLSKKIDTQEELYEYLHIFMTLFDDLIKKITEKKLPFTPKPLETIDCIGDQNANVEMYTKNLRDILSLPLTIPNYQRDYCWEEENVKCLLNDIFCHLDNQISQSDKYRMGSIILHNNNGKYDIIDGQQRLITLSLLINELGVYPKLLDEKLGTKKSLKYIAFNKYLIKSHIQKNMQKTPNLSGRVLDLLEFSVLVLKNTSLDLAYTFFSNQNSRGVELTDYDLLKAHHLRFIPQTYEQQSMRAAQVWNKMIEDGRKQSEEYELPDYERTLDTYIYRLRKWMRKKECLDGSNNRRIKKEYEAAPIIDDIPPFGEKFYFYEPIQGGTHFFSYVEQHLTKYHHFIKTHEFKCLHHGLNGGSHQWYRDSIESILFGYYLKYNSYYLADALVVIMRIILQHRYVSKRAHKGSIVQYVSESELILMIDQATSPTFFLAEAKNLAHELSYPLRKNMSPIQLDMRSRASYISQSLSNSIVSNPFKTINK